HVRANEAADRGGGLRVLSREATADVAQSAFNYNRAARGGGINNCGEVAIENVSFQGNSASSGTAIRNEGVLSVEFATVNASGTTGTGIELGHNEGCAAGDTRFGASLVLASCDVLPGASVSSDGGNLYGPAGSACPTLPGADGHWSSNGVFG